jgi:NADP-dependent 3-hydroxy acid dehydrogenase YdfG
MSVAIVFGASGSIGSAIGEHLLTQGFDVIRVGRSKNSASPTQFSSWVIWNEDAGEFSRSLSEHLAGKKIDAIVWAQGTNLNDDIDSFDNDDDSDRNGNDRLKANAVVVDNNTIITTPSIIFNMKTLFYYCYFLSIINTISIVN